MKTPIAFIIFNRPDHTKKVFEVIRRAQPSKLMVIADGPRVDRPDDIERCAAARAVIDRVDWECEVFKNFSDKNLGCGMRPATGISWVFETVEEAIILEDDCIPHPSFFGFCEELLDRYRFDQRVMHISGNNYWGERYQRDDNYVFSRYALSWGWATWKRAWQHYDFELKLWTEVNQRDVLTDLLGDRHTVNTWMKIFQRIGTDPTLDCWDYQWILSCWLQNGLSILPSVNLVSNIGFGADATHTFTSTSFALGASQLSVAAQEMELPLKHPKLMIRDAQIDQFIQDFYYDYYPKLPKRIRKLPERMRVKLSSLLG